MSICIGEKAPDFLAQTTQGSLSFYDWAKASWVILFSHPADFTPVCTSELCRTVELIHAFERRGVKLLGLSTDEVDQHTGWLKHIQKLANHLPTFPIIADPDCRIARLYEMIHPQVEDTQAVRSLFVIDPTLTVRLSMNYPMTVGRNFSEVLRVIDALQLGDDKHVVTPADWVPGNPVLIPESVSDHAAQKQFPQGWQSLLPYYRLTVV